MYVKGQFGSLLKDRGEGVGRGIEGVWLFANGDARNKGVPSWPG